jgi:hypothetical protein
MTAGLPGTGIGGIFYLLLAFIMPVHELYLVCRGRSSWSRWRLIGVQLANASGIVGSLVLTGWLVQLGAGHLARAKTGMAGVAARYVSVHRVEQVTSVSPAWLTLAALAMVVVGVIVLAAVLAVTNRLARPIGAAQARSDEPRAVGAGTELDLPEPVDVA